MLSTQQRVVIGTVLLLSLLALCGCEEKPTAMLGSTGDDAPAASSSDDSPSSSKIQPWSPDGSAKVTYEYVYDDPPAWVASAYVEIPVTIEIPTDLPEGADWKKGPFRVTGEAKGTLYTQYYGAGAGGGCFIHCDFGGTYRVEGELRHHQGEEASSCYFSLDITAEMDPNEVSRYGNCPQGWVQQFDCTLLVTSPQNHGGNPWLFVRGTDLEVVTHVLPYNPKATEKVTLSGVEMFDMDQAEGSTCEWGSEK